MANFEVVSFGSMDPEELLALADQLPNKTIFDKTGTTFDLIQAISLLHPVDPREKQFTRVATEDITADQLSALITGLNQVPILSSRRTVVYQEVGHLGKVFLSSRPTNHRLRPR